MFRIEFDTMRTLNGDDNYSVRVKIGNQSIPYEAELTTEFYFEADEFIQKWMEYLAGKGIEHVQIVDNLYCASATPDTHEYIADVTMYAEIGKKWKDYWVSAYTMRGELFMASIVATDDEDFDREFERAFPDCDYADYGCWDDYKED